MRDNGNCANQSNFGCRILERFLAPNVIPKGDYFILATDVAVSCPKVQKSDFQSQFSTSKMMRMFQKIFPLKHINLGANFLLLTFFDNFNFLKTLFSKMMPKF